MPKLIRIRLTTAQREELVTRQRQIPMADRRWDRLEMVRLADWGRRAPAIAECLAVDVQTVRKYLKAFATGGFAALADRPRPGRPPRLQAADLAALEALLDRDAAGERTWTLPQLTDWLASERGVPISANRLSRVLRARRFRGKRTKRSVQHKADPVRQAEKTADLRTLEAFAAEEAVARRYLDASGFSPSLPLSYTWAREGVRPLLRFEAAERRRVNVLGAWAPLGAQPAFTYTTTTGTLTSAAIREFLWRDLGALPTPLGEVPAGFGRERPLVVVLDNASTHVSTVFKAHRALLAQVDIHLFYLPTYSPHLNPLELLWRQIKYEDIPVRSYRTIETLQQAVCAALDHYVRNPSLCDDNLRATAYHRTIPNGRSRRCSLPAGAGGCVAS
jgi:transposase